MSWEGRYNDLQNQVKKITKKVNLGSIKTKQRYIATMSRFNKFLAKTNGPRKIKNISGKHLNLYVKYLQAKGCKPAHILSELSGIRRIHDLITDAKYALPSDNKCFGIEQRQNAKTHRAWSEKEFLRMLEIARREEDPRYGRLLGLARHAGLRIHEAFRIDRAAAERAIRKQELVVKGKGGKVRTVPCSPETIRILEESIRGLPRGSKLFATPGQTHLQIKEMQEWIENHRATARDEERALGLKTGVLFSVEKGIMWGDLTYHGLRHAYAQEQYHLRLKGKIAQGLDEKEAMIEAKKEVSQLLGHNRIEVVNIYLA